MSEQIYTFSDEELARMFKSGEMRLLTKPEEVAHDEPKIPKELLERAEILQIGGMDKEALMEKLLQDFDMSEWALELYNSPFFSVSPTARDIKIVMIGLDRLGFKGEKITYEKIIKNGQNLGLELCPAEVGPYLRLKYTSQPDNTSYYIMMEPIKDSDGVACIFNVTNSEVGLKLYGSFSHFWSPYLQHINDRFVFSMQL